MIELRKLKVGFLIEFGEGEEREVFFMNDIEAKKLFEQLEDELWEPEESHRYLDSELTKYRMMVEELQEENQRLREDLNHLQK